MSTTEIQFDGQSVTITEHRSADPGRARFPARFPRAYTVEIDGRRLFVSRDRRNRDNNYPEAPVRYAIYEKTGESVRRPAIASTDERFDAPADWTQLLPALTAMLAKNPVWSRYPATKTY